LPAALPRQYGGKELVTDQNQYGNPFPLGELLGDDVHLWIVDLDDRSVPAARVNSILSAEERERAARFVFEPDAWHFSLCRAILRLGLATHCKRPAAEITIQAGEHGKPFVENEQIHFNVSHSRSMGLLAFTRIGELGVDVEAVQPDIEALEISSAHFTPGEAAWIAATPVPSERAHRFTRLWTRKEAVLKATGKGIGERLSSFDVYASNTVLVRIHHAQIVHKEMYLIVKDIDISEGFYASLALPDGTAAVTSITVSPNHLFSALQGPFV
jgi:4'-phosphopantetheinyl transferase